MFEQAFKNIDDILHKDAGVSTMPMYPADATLNADGTITWDGGIYPSPSAAGAAVKGGKATNGWSFWAIETDTGKVALATLRSRLPQHPELQP